MRKFVPKRSALVIIDILIFLLCLTVTAVAVNYLFSFRIFMWIAICLFWGIGIVFGAFLLPFYFKRTAIYLSVTEISLHSGLLWLSREHMRLSAVQYITKIDVPLGRRLGFVFITAHGLGGSIIMPFLSYDDAEEIFNSLTIAITEK